SLADKIRIRPAIVPAPVATASSPSTRPGKLHTVVSMPGNIDSETTKKTMAKLINPSKDNIIITKCQPLPNGKVRVAFGNPQSQQKFIAATKESKQLTCEPPRSTNALIYLKGIPKAVSLERIHRTIVQFNPSISNIITKEQSSPEDAIKLVFKRNNRKDHLINCGLSVLPPIRDHIMTQTNGRVLVEFDQIHVEDCSPLKQCFNCHLFHHYAKDCKVSQSVCTHCAQQHLFQECPNRNLPPTCANCSRAGASVVNHTSFSPECPVLLKMQRRMFDQKHSK
ncbi:hypothetical protein BLA29_008446, partial [Euroglyphus maynei]